MGAELTARPTDAEFLARARALVPVLAAREAAAATARNVPAETIAGLRETGLLRLLRPRRVGGYQGSIGGFRDAGLLSEEAGMVLYGRFLTQAP